jgi:ABC-type nitrate/sulfonate/bicarbonate transport system permease component
MATPSTLVKPEPTGRYAPRVQRYPLTRRQRLARALSTRDRLLQLGLLALILGVWELVGRRSDRFTFAPPSSVVSAAGNMIESGELQRAVTDSLTPLALGFAMGVWRTFGRTLDPFVAALYVVPIAAIVPAIVAWTGLGLESRVLVVFLFAVFEPLLAAYAGVKQVDPALYDAARTFGARRGDLVRRVTLPATLPFVFVGLRMGAARAVKGMVLAEMLFSVTGLGRLIVESAQDFRIDRVLVAVVAVSLMGVLLTAMVKVAERYALRWRR